ncbi:hypothetical protein IKO50_05575, partial [bacterium]|nr:hypothetical protein [bacterium]
MPKPRFDTTSAKDYLLRFGYSVPDNFRYHNMNDKIRMYDLANERTVQLSMKQVIYRTEEAPTRRPEYDSLGIERLMNIDFQPGRIAVDSEDRLLRNNPATLQFINSNVPNNQVDELKRIIKQQLPNTVRTLRQAINGNGTTVFEVPDEDELENTALK